MRFGIPLAGATLPAIVVASAAPEGDVENYYDHDTRRWVTAGSRYEAIANQPRFSALYDPLIAAGPELTWTLILELLAEVPDDLVHMVGAGPLQNFIVTHGPAFVAEIEAAAKESERFRRCVIEVDLHSGELPPHVESRLVAAFGPRFALLPPWPEEAQAQERVA